MMCQLWFDLKNKTHYLLDECVCGFCKGKFEIGIYARVWNKKKSHDIKSCMLCVSKLKKELVGECVEVFHILRKEEVGEYMIPVLAIRPELSTFRGDLSVFEAYSLDSVRVVDHTKYCGFSLEGAKIGTSIREVSDDALLDLEGFDKKLLECKKK